MNLPISTQLWRGIEIGMLQKRWGKFFISGKDVMDLGCGEGEIAKEVFGGKQIEWGLDCDREMVEKAKKCGIYKNVLFESAQSISLPNDSVRMVFSNSVLEHIPNVNLVLKEVSRVLKQGGRFITTMPSNRLGEYLGWGKIYTDWFNNKYNHYHLYDLGVWKKMFEQVGIQIEDSYYYLDQKTIKQWHKLLWKQKLGIGNIQMPKEQIVLRECPSGAAIAILGRKK